MIMPSEKRVTIADVARAAHVSRTLVSFVLNGREEVASATRARILQAIEELGYRPNTIARNLATKRAGAIGIVCDMETYQDGLDMQFLAAILATAAQLGQRVMLIPADDRQIQEVAEDHAVDGIIFLDERVDDPRIAHLTSMGVSATGLWDGHLDVVLHKGCEELALHLESRGHQQAICLCGSDDKLFVMKFKQIMMDTLQERGITATASHCPSGKEAEVARSLARELSGKHVTAIVASSDALAIHAIHGLYAARLRVPDNCAVSGFGDVPAAQLVQPPLTTIRVPVSAVALWAVNKICKPGEMDGYQPPDIFPSSRLIIRRSC
jgi:DNA-binding LacI/PurR family transcriptional regulator